MIRTNAAKPYHSPSFEHRVKPEHMLSLGEVANRFIEIQTYTRKPLQTNLSGLKLEYAVVQVYSKDAGQREAEISYHVGQGSQDIGFRNAVSILFDVKPAVKVKLKIRDFDGEPAMASLLITDDQARSYFRNGGGFTYDQYVQSLQSGKSYVSDGKLHLMDFTVVEVASGGSLSVKKGKKLSITAKAAAYLPVKQDSLGALTARTPPDKMPYWDIERARSEQSRNVKVELVINGKAVAAKEIAADGKVQEVHFDYAPEQSCWAAIRIYPSTHSNPVFIEVEGKPVRDKKSAEWCLSALEQCWKMKEPNIRTEEKEAARKAYEEARVVYRKLANAD